MWVEKTNDLLTELLYAMGLSLGYTFDKVQIKRNAYLPIGHAEIERESNDIRKGLLGVFKGLTAIPVTITSAQSNAEDAEEQKKIRKLMIDHYEGKIAIPVKVVTGEE